MSMKKQKKDKVVVDRFVLTHLTCIDPAKGEQLLERYPDLTMSDKLKREFDSHIQICEKCQETIKLNEQTVSQFKQHSSEFLIKDMYERGRSFLIKGQYETAIKLLLMVRDMPVSRKANKLIKAKAIGNLAACLQFQNRHREALKYLLEAEVIFKKLGDKVALDTVFHNITAILYYESEYKVILKRYQESLRLARTHKDKLGEALALDGMGLVQMRLGKLSHAVKSHSKSFRLFNNLDEKELSFEEKHRYLAVNRNNIGVVYTGLGMNKEALGCFTDALKTAKQIGEARVVVWANDSFGDYYFRTGDFKNATIWHGKSLALNKKTKDTFGLAVSNNNIGCDFWLKNQYKDALGYHRKARSLVEKSQIGGELERSCIELSLGVDHLFLGDANQAGEHFNAALQIARKLGNRENEINALAWLGIHFWQAEDAKLAEKHLTQAARLAKETGLANIQARILFHTGAIWNLLGDDKKARQLFDKIPKLLKPSEISLLRKELQEFRATKRRDQKERIIFHSTRMLHSELSLSQFSVAV